MTSVASSAAHRLIAEALQPGIPSAVNVEPGDWERLWSTARSHCLIPYLHQRWSESGTLDRLPPALAERFAHARSQNTERNRRLLADLRDVCAALQDHGIPALVLKGLPLAQEYYGDLGLRVLYDLDLLVKVEDSSRALQILREKGYVPYSSEPRGRNDDVLLWKPAAYTWTPETVFDPGQPTFLDLHTQPWTQRWHGFRLDCKLDLWPDHRWREMDGTAFRVPSNERTLVQLTVHYAFNVVESNARLMHLLDVALLLRQRERDLDWEGILRHAVASRVAPFCFLTLDLSRRVCGSNIPEKIWRALRDLTPRQVVTWLGLEGAQAARAMNLHHRERSLIYFLHWAMAPDWRQKLGVLSYSVQSPWREGRWRTLAARMRQRIRHLLFHFRR